MSHYLGDRKLLPRVRQYLDEHKQQRSTSIEAMVEDLQARYSDYGRKKKRAFMKSVEKAYSIVQKENHYQDRAAELENQHLLKRRKKDFSSESEGEEKSFSDSAEYVTYEDTNAMNSMMTSLYQRNPSVKKVASQSPVSSTPASPQHVSSTDIAEARHANTQGFLIDRKGFKPASATPCDTDKLMKHTKPAGRDKQSVDSSESKTDKTVPQCQVTSRAAVTKSAMETGTSVVDSQGLRGVKGTESPVPTKQRGAETPAPTKLKRVKKSDRLKDSDEKKKTPEVQQSTTKFSDVGGNEDTLKEVCKLLVHMRHPEVYEQLGITPPRGFLLHGPPGCGKTLLANAIAGELELPFLKIAATEIVSGVSGESEEKLRDVFSKALASAPCILFIDEIDAITQKRETASKDMERRIVSQLLTCMDDLNIKGSGHILVIGATNRPDSLDPALRRAGRFDREIALGIPDENARMRILQVLCRDLKLSLGFDFLHLARHTPGYVGADLMALGREAAMIAVNRAFKEIQQAAHQNNQKPQEAATENRQSVTENKHAVTENRQAVTENRPAGKEVRQTTAEVSQTMAEVTQAEIEVSQADTGVNQSASQSSPMAIIVSHAATDTCHTEVSQSEQMETNQASLPREEDGPSKDKVEQVVSSSVTARGTMIIPSVNHTDTDSLASVMCWLKEQPPLSENQLQDLFITMDDFQEALQVVQPSAKREGFATVPDVTWDDIGALRDIREELQMAILAPVRHPEHFKSLGLTTPPGILLTGPPGCGKTLLAKAVANESGINFISVKGPELLNMYVGESERAVRQVFQRARNSAPCVIFFDELDALCPRRSDSGEGGSSVRVVNQLLTEMDGLQERKQVFIMGATNRPDIIDPAVLRPGRLDKTLYVGLPSVKDREDILKTITKNGTKPKLAEDVSLQVIAEDSHCERFTGADLAALVREAAVTALREFMSGSQSGCFTNITINSQHFKTAFKKVLPSVSVKDQNLYNKMKDRLYDR